MTTTSAYRLRLEIIRVTRIVANQGSSSAARTLEGTLIALERLEHAADTHHLARVLGEPQPLPERELEKLRALGNKIRAKIL